MAYLRRYKPNRWQWLFALSLSVMLFVTIPPLWALTSTPQQDLQRLNGYIEQALTKANAKDFQGSQRAYKQFDNEWFDVEDGVKKTSRQTYRDVESAMNEVKFALLQTPPDQSQVVAALLKLQAIDQKFIAGGSTLSAETTPTSTSQVTIASLIERLKRAEVAIDKQDNAKAADEIKGFQTDWLEVEGIVKTKSKQAYVDVENNMTKAVGFLKANPADVTGAQSAIASLKLDLQPYSGKSLRYNLFDAAVILLREGLEALLVLIALIAFLNKSGNADKQRWLWVGAGVGVLASLLTAVVINVLFSNVGFGANRELLEGITGLVAAAMLFYVSYWLHSKSSLGAWQGYINNQMNAALATNSIFSLAFLAFLAVFREGAETTLFYIGIAPAISTTDLFAGLALGTVLLVIIAALMLGLGLKIPLKPFFLVTSILIYYLGFRFIGAGIHSLQVAGILSATPGKFLPASEGLGLYPTWETTLPQIALLVGALAVVIYTKKQAERTLESVRADAVRKH